MPNRSREKGNRFEYECRDIAIENGLNCKKVPLSGACPDAPGDLEIEGLLYQCKVKRKMPAWAVPAEAEVGVIFKEDRGEISIKIPYTKFCQYLACWHGKYMEES